MERVELGRFLGNISNDGTLFFDRRDWKELLRKIPLDTDASVKPNTLRITGYLLRKYRHPNQSINIMLVRVVDLADRRGTPD